MRSAAEADCDMKYQFAVPQRPQTMNTPIKRDKKLVSGPFVISSALLIYTCQVLNPKTPQVISRAKSPTVDSPHRSTVCSDAFPTIARDLNSARIFPLAYCEPRCASDADNGPQSTSV